MAKTTPPKGKKPIHMFMPENLLEKLEAAAEENGTCRAHEIIQRLNRSFKKRG